MSIFAAANGVVIATEKKLPSILVDETSVSVANSFLYFLFCCNMSFHCSQKCLTNTFTKNSRCKRFSHWHQILELFTGTTLSWLMSYSFCFHILELECTVIILKFIMVVEVIELCCIFSIAKSISHTLHLALFSVVWVQISVFWWEKAESRRNSIIGCTRYTFGKLFSLVPCNYFYIRVSLDLGKGRHNSIISREGLILGTYILNFLH